MEINSQAVIEPNFYCNLNTALQVELRDFLESLKLVSTEANTPVYVINKPLGENKYSYDIDKSFILLIPKYKILFVDGGDNYEDFVLDFIDDLGALADKYNHKEILGRPRTWEDKYISKSTLGEVRALTSKTLLDSIRLENFDLQRKSELLISLAIGSINDIKRIGDELPNTPLDRIKQKIILFDSEQTKFIFQESSAKIIRIQGLSGTGKTELLLHKIKELYLKPVTPKIALTCHNKILASSLSNRLPNFFDFMKVEQQIKWNEKLFCFHAWGSANNRYSGLYRYLCSFYDINFYTWSHNNSFKRVCQIAINDIKAKKEQLDIEKKYAFDYILIDESQDFPDEFFELCKIVTKEKLYIAGDIFQSIFDNNILADTQPDYLLNKCYRTEPKTLMLAHSLGMGVFENHPIRYLSKEEWVACGYVYKEVDNQSFTLTRAPLRRFEDIAVDPFRIDYFGFSTNEVVEHIKKIIEQVLNDNPTVKAEDICIVFPLGKTVFKYADHIENMLNVSFGYQANKAYESKESIILNSVFITNKNNVKGLEFAFVICVIPYLYDVKNRANLADRNSIYMSLSRSYLQSYLLLDNNDEYIKSEIVNFDKGATNLLQSDLIEGKKLTISQQETLRSELLALRSKSLNLDDVISGICNRLGHLPDKKLREIVALTIEGEIWDEQIVEKIISNQIQTQQDFFN